MYNFSSNNVFDHHNKTIFVNDNPYQHAHIKKFLPDNLIEKVCNSFYFPKQIESTSDALFQKTKRGLNDYKRFNKITNENFNNLKEIETNALFL